MWSGRSRKVEIAESFLQPLLTMLRRNGKLRWSEYRKVTIHDEDVGEPLRAKWKAWVEQESFKRFCFRILQHDTSCSIALLTNPLISYAEVLLPFPDSADLWAASTAEEWKTALLSRPQNPSSEGVLTLARYLDDPSILDAYQSTVDITVVSFAFLSCAWSLSWELIQLRSLQRGGSSRWNALLLASRHDELLKLLDNFRISTDFSHLTQAYGGEITMRLELVHMHLHMPFEDLQLFAGMEGPEQARVVYPAILDWARSEAARKAVWHGGQIVQAARLLPKGSIWGPAAIAVYHASLAFWVFGLLSGDGARAQDTWAPGRLPSQPPVYLDSSAGIALQRFTQLGSGKPCIRGCPSPTDGMLHGDHVPVAYLSQPDTVMAAVISVMVQNHEGMARPHLVDNFIQLMKGLQKASTKTVVE